jgi:hypothetical protein
LELKVPCIFWHSLHLYCKTMMLAFEMISFVFEHNYQNKALDV